MCRGQVIPESKEMTYELFVDEIIDGILNEQIWVYIIKSGVGPTINGLFEPYFYLLFADPQSYLGEFPGKLTTKFNQILG